MCRIGIHVRLHTPPESNLKFLASSDAVADIYVGVCGKPIHGKPYLSEQSHNLKTVRLVF
jgi:hypothetical protein